MARSRAFRWGEDGIAGVSDTHGFQNIAFAFWNEMEYATASLDPKCHTDCFQRFPKGATFWPVESTG